MEKKLKAMFIGSLMLLWMVGFVSAGMSAEEQEVTSIICTVLESLKTILYVVAGGIAAVVITLQGIKWAGSADDPGARKQAKEGIIHAIIGLIIVMVAIALVTMVFTSQTCVT